MVASTPKKNNEEDVDFGVEALKTEISGRIREAIRETRGNTDVSEKSGVSLRTIANYISGNSEPKIISLSKIAQVCGVSLDWIATGTGPKHPIEPSKILDAEVLEVSFKIAEEMFGNQNFTPEYKAKILMVIYEKGLEEKKNG